MEPIADKKRAIFESTLELVRENGFHGTPMSMVAKRAGVAAGTIYHYFKSKDQLIHELFAYAQQKPIQVISEENCETIPFKDCFFNLWFGLFTFYTRQPNVLKFFEQFLNSPYSADRPSLEQDDFFSLFIAFFERGITEGKLKKVSPKILATLANSSIITAVKLAGSDKITLQERELRQIPELLWDGMKQAA
ncbi:TetR/AcrR family transcriptional regulator [Pontibacter sp. BT327]|uniref:TetR/AcrR family transcriptional regulator n=2 Tax=Pontibacter burrus TaxID=2704466 RepID=A0A6B3LZX7_9BACT|nr:TetR/AcrR family transcriptional regulator [Pontibacter burrus]